MTATLAGLSYCELSSMFPNVGGEFLYLKKAFPKFSFPSKLIGFMMIVSGISSAAAVSISFAGYLNVFFPYSLNLMALILLYSFTIFSLFGIKQSGWINIFFTIIEISGLVIFIYFGYHARANYYTFLSLPTLATVTGSSLIIFAYFGFENLINFAEETKKPEINIPKAILISIAFSTILYILVILSALSLLTIDELSHSQAPLADALLKTSSQAANILASIALFATANTVLISLVSSSRILLGLSRNNVVPSLFSLLRTKNGVPWVATLTISFFSTLFIYLGNLEVLASVSSFSSLIAFLAVHIALLRLRHTQPALVRPFKIPFSLFNYPITALLGTFITIWLILQFNARVYIIGSSLILISSLTLWLIHIFSKK
jgi:amino acid transporter